MLQTQYCRAYLYVVHPLKMRQRWRAEVSCRVVPLYHYVMQLLQLVLPCLCLAWRNVASVYAGLIEGPQHISKARSSGSSPRRPGTMMAKLLMQQLIHTHT